MHRNNTSNSGNPIWQRIKRFFNIHPAILFFVAVSSLILVSMCLGGVILQPAVKYFSYLYSSYALAAVCINLPDVFRRFKAWIRQLTLKYDELAYILHFIQDMERRTKMLLIPSLVFNLSYALFKLVSGLWLHSPWLFGAGIYYIVLAALRYSLIRSFYSDNTGPYAAWKAYRNTALWMLVLTLAMSGIIVQMVISGKTNHYPGPLIYAFALYAFIKIISAISAMIRYRNGENLLLAASRCVSFACALMSLLVLQTALIHEFGSDPAFALRANAILGFAVCILMLGICFSMLLRCLHCRPQTPDRNT